MKKNSKSVKEHGQQGDLLFRRIGKLPEGERTEVSKGRCVLADGEHTGHQHVLECEDAELIRIGERMLLSLPEQAIVVHPEHGPITLEPGIWEVGRVREYDWFSKMERQVVD